MSFTHQAILLLLFFTVGCCVGSFVNVCVYRIPLGLSLLRPGSRCPRCYTPIRGRDNVPVLSWLLLRGECRDCGCGIPAQYPGVEFAFGLAFAGIYLADVAAAGGDPWERTGLIVEFAKLLALWASMSVFFVLLSIGFDQKRASARRPDRPGIGGQDQGLTQG